MLLSQFIHGLIHYLTFSRYRTCWGVIAELNFAHFPEYRAVRVVNGVVVERDNMLLFENKTDKHALVDKIRNFFESGDCNRIFAITQQIADDPARMQQIGANPRAAVAFRQLQWQTRLLETFREAFYGGLYVDAPACTRLRLLFGSIMLAYVLYVSSCIFNSF
jgi:hypothetical protein